MAIRLYSEFLSDQGAQYKIELHDSEWLGGAHQFECGDDGFTLNYSGDTDDIISPIISSEVEVGVALRTGQVLNYFDALKTYQENRFRVVILKANSVPPPSQVYRERVIADGGTLEGMDCVQNAIEALGGDDYSLFWAGWVMQDLVTLEDASQPYFMRLKAVDGIGRLANIEYTDTNSIAQNGLGITRNNLVIYNCLEAAGTSDLWAADTAFLETSVDWWEVTKMTYATTDDPLYLSGVDVNLFASKDNDGNTTEPIPSDIAGYRRIQGSAVDLGAYEYGNELMPAAPQYSISAIASTGGTVSGGGTFDEDASVTLTATPSNSGYIFSGWSGDASGTSNPLTITADSDKTITANFSKDNGDDDGDGISNYEEIVTYGTSKSSNDSDGDGLTDKEETDRGLNPNSSDKAIIDAVMELKGMKADNVTPIVSGWYYVPDQGWFWTDKDAYPYTYSASEGDWLYFQSGNESPRFYHYKTKTWKTRE